MVDNTPRTPIRLWDIRDTNPESMARALNEAQQGIVELQDIVNSLNLRIKELEKQKTEGGEKE